MTPISNKIEDPSASRPPAAAQDHVGLGGSPHQAGLVEAGVEVGERRGRQVVDVGGERLLHELVAHDVGHTGLRQHRRREAHGRPHHGQRAGGLSVDLVKRIVKVDGREVKLSPKEYDILRILVQHAGKVLTHQFILDRIWDKSTDVQYLRVYVRQLRQKLEETPDQPQYIVTETGVGYRLREAD